MTWPDKCPLMVLHVFQMMPWTKGMERVTGKTTLHLKFTSCSTGRGKGRLQRLLASLKRKRGTPFLLLGTASPVPTVGAPGSRRRSQACGGSLWGGLQQGLANGQGEREAKGDG